VLLQYKRSTRRLKDKVDVQTLERKAKKGKSNAFSRDTKSSNYIFLAYRSLTRRQKGKQTQAKITKKT